MSENKKILIYTCGEVIGDGVIKLPFIRALKEAIPDYHLTWCCSGDTVYNGPLKEIALKFIDEVITLPKASDLKFLDLFSKHPLADKYFDIIIDTQTKIKPSLWLRKIPHGEFISAAVKGLFSTLPVNDDVFKEKNIFKSLIKLGSSALGKDLNIQEIELPDERYIKEAEKILPADKKYLGFVVGAGQDFKIWPLDNFVKLANIFEDKGFTPVVFLGPMEADMLPVIKEVLPNAIVPLGAPEGMRTTYLTMAMGARIEAALTNDSGGSHLVAVGGAPMVIISKSKNISKKFMPFLPKVTPFYPEEYGSNEVKDIPFEEVKTAVEKALKN